MRLEDGTEKDIEDLEPGEEVQCWDPQGEKGVIGLVEKILKATSSAYYKIKLKNGTEIKVTAEHPLFGIPRASISMNFWQYLKSESLTKKTVDFLLNLVRR